MSKRRIAFVDRDGTLIEEPDDEQIDRYHKLKLLPDVVPALRDLLAHGYELVMVSNQDGLGTSSFPQDEFDGPHDLMMDIFATQGVTFSAVHIDPTLPEDNAWTRKPGLGMVLDYLKSGELDLDASCVIGDRDTDLQLAENMGIRGIRVGPDGLSWPEIADDLVNRPRIASVHRKTSETDIEVWVNLDKEGEISVDSGIGFLDHMFDQLARHGGFSLRLKCDGDLEIDEHHSVEDCALAFGEALRLALRDKRGIGRFGFCLPMDETQAKAVIDLSGRPFLRYEGELPTTHVGQLSTQMVPHFFRSLSDALRANIHISVDGDNAHHMVEASFKSLARALRPALAREGATMPSTKGSL